MNRLWESMRTGALAAAIATTALLAHPTYAQAPKLTDTSACARSDFRVAVDVGHTRDATGARSARGYTEYDFNLVLGREIEQALLAAGFKRTVLLVTDGPAQQSLFRRVAQASKLQAHLFLSVHHDSVPDVFLLKWNYEGSTRPFSDAYKGHSIFISGDNAQSIASLRFGHLLGMQMKARGLQYTTQYTEPLLGNRRRVLVDQQAGVYRFDQLVVLRHTPMPAVLLEAGSIINRDEELLAASPDRQKLIAAAATAAVEEFCAIRMPKNERRARPKIGPIVFGAPQPATPR
jgi:N-acetylmuramoyl-L-alanine amidase